VQGACLCFIHEGAAAAAAAAAAAEKAPKHAVVAAAAAAKGCWFWCDEHPLRKVGCGGGVVLGLGA